MEQMPPVNPEQTSLMRKTKAQLIEIILRKDSVEKHLRGEIACKSSAINALKERIDDLNIRITELTELNDELEITNDKLEHQYQQECDDHVVEMLDYHDKVKGYKVATIAVGIGFIVALIANFL